MICSFRMMTWRFAALATLMSLAACSSLDAPLPAGTTDPASFNNEDGALRTAQGAVDQFRRSWMNGVVVSGLLSDELQPSSVLRFASGATSSLTPDLRVAARLMPEFDVTGASQPLNGAATLYTDLQKSRGAAQQGIGMLAKYAPPARASIRGQLYLTMGYAELMLADVFCSGIPLSTLDFEKDFTYAAGSTTAAVYEHAAALFDTAIVIAADSGALVSAARIGKGRALLALGRYADAAAAVAAVPTAFTYQFSVYWSMSPFGAPPRGSTQSLLASSMTVSDQKGENGLPYRSSGDVRSAVTQSNATTPAQYFPAKYLLNQASPFTLADGVEARLIEAEAALQPAANPAGDWLTPLNELRATRALADTTDPGTEAGRVDLLFRERALWLFITGHRQGDLRRLIRQYHRAEDAVYPTGFYPGGYGVYGSDVTAPIPLAELVNPLYKGCLNRDA
jgi:hypothetical protein